MKFIFTHLLARVLCLGSERAVLMTRQKDNIAKWVKERDDRGKHLKNIKVTARDSKYNQDAMEEVLMAVADAQPSQFNLDQQKMIDVLKKIFSWSTEDYKAMMRAAAKANLDDELLELLRNEQLEAPGQKEESDD